jgi:hypothetical protein
MHTIVLAIVGKMRLRFIIYKTLKPPLTVFPVLADNFGRGAKAFAI